MRIGLISDVHWMVGQPAFSDGWYGAGEFAGALDRLQQALHHFDRDRVDLVVLSGDLAHKADVESLASVLATCASVSVPVLVVAGNHDVAGDIHRLERARELAAQPRIALPHARGSVVSGVRVAGVHVGEVDGWLRPRLRAFPDLSRWRTDPAVLISHYPVLSLAEKVAGAGLPYPGDLLDRADVATALLERRAPTIVIGGHVHVRATETDGAILQLTVGALIEPPYECAVIDVNTTAAGNLVVHRENVRLFGASDPADSRFAPGRETWHYSGGKWTNSPQAARDLVDEIREIVDRETRAWDEQNVDLLLSVFHRDMVWPWPPSPDVHDPVNWVWGMGRFDRTRWRREWEELFATHALVHNDRATCRIDITADGQGALAVVDVDTRWQHRGNGSSFDWRGRACKVYARIDGEWKMTMHTGLLTYPPPSPQLTADRSNAGR